MIEDAIMEWGLPIDVYTFEELCTRRPPEGKTCYGRAADRYGILYIWNGNLWIEIISDSIEKKVSDLIRRVELLEERL